MSKSQRDAQLDKVAWNHVEFPHLILDLRVYFRHAPAHRCKHAWFGAWLCSCLPAEPALVR